MSLAGPLQKEHMLLCKMEDDKVNWGKPQRLIVSGVFMHKDLKLVIQLENQTQTDKPTSYRYFQKGTCGQKVTMKIMAKCISCVYHLLCSW